jgi:hypothetical protein
VVVVTVVGLAPRAQDNQEQMALAVAVVLQPLIPQVIKEQWVVLVAVV